MESDKQLNKNFESYVKEFEDAWEEYFKDKPKPKLE